MPTAESRGERKERTRRAILDATLALCVDSSLVALSLRQVTKEVGIVPTAFYRHFDSIEDLGLALVEESFASLREMLRDVRRSDPTYQNIIDSSVKVLGEHVQRHPGGYAQRGCRGHAQPHLAQCSPGALGGQEGGDDAHDQRCLDSLTQHHDEGR